MKTFWDEERVWGSGFNLWCSLWRRERFNFLALEETEIESQGKAALFFLAAITPSSQTRPHQQTLNCCFYSSVKKNNKCRKNVSEFSFVAHLTKCLCWMSNLEHLCQPYLILFSFNYSVHSIPLLLSSLHLYGHHKKKKKSYYVDILSN